MRPLRVLIGVLVMSAALSRAQPQATGPLSEQHWRHDIAFLARELPKRHKNAFASLTRAHFERQVTELQARIPNLSEGEMRAAIMKLVASLGDTHTSVWGDGRPYAFRFIPIRLSWFKDGIFITTAAQQYRSLLSGRLVRIGETSIDEACRRLAPYAAHENDSCLKANLPGALVNADLLYAAGVIDSPGRAVVEVDSPSGQRLALSVQTLTEADRPQPAQAYTGDPPLLQRNDKTPYWATLIDNSATIYFQYNQCRDDPGHPFAAFRSELRQLESRDTVRRLVLDLRNNGGGDNQVVKPWIKEFRSSRLNRKGQFFVLIGPRTFSSAVYHATKLRDETAATLVGEPTCGKPNCYGNVRILELPNSRIPVAYSTGYFRLRPVDEPWLMPDILVETSSKDYLAGVDPVLNAVLR